MVRNAPPVLRVAIDTRLVEKHRPEMLWALKEALAALGYGWRETEWSQEADLRYALTPGDERRGVTILGRPWGALAASGATLSDEDVASVGAGSGVVVQRDIVRDLFDLMTGRPELEWPANRHGHRDVPATLQASLRRAVGSRWVSALGEVLRHTGQPPGIPKWPGNAAAAAALTHDVDYPEVVRMVEPFRVVRRLGLGGLNAAWRALWGQSHHWHFATWMDLERALGIRAAFYFGVTRGSLVAYACGRPDPFYDIRHPRIVSVIRELVDGGWEVGLHAGYDAWKTPGAFEREKAALERVVGRPVSGLRHHYWHVDTDRPAHTLQQHADAGFLYDASIAHDRCMGFRRGVSWPFFPWNPETGRAVEALQLPTSWMDEHSFQHWCGSPGGAGAARDEMLRAVIDTGGVLVANVHEYVVDAWLYPGRFEAARTLWTEVAGDPRWWVAPPTEVARHWRNRRVAIESASLGLVA